MKRKEIVLRAGARDDVESAIDFHRREAGEEVALEFVDSLEIAYRSIALHPAAASLRYAYELAVPGLRSKPLPKFPYLIFYVERLQTIDVWRILHAHRDLPTSLAHSDDV